MSINLLNNIFYNDITNIILDYYLKPVKDIKYNKFMCCRQLLSRWSFAASCYKKAGVKVPMSLTMFLDHCIYMDWLC